MTTIQANQLVLGYNGHNVIDGLAMHAAAGEILGLVGPNGTGKTTVLRGLAGLLQPRDGVVMINGSDLKTMSNADRARCIGLVPQGETHAWPLAVEEIVTLGRAPHRGWMLPMSADDRAVVNRVIDLTGLNLLRQRPINKLSGGERQRVMIARALAQEPQALLLDEPTANLDIHHQLQVLQLIRGLVDERRLTAIVAIHDLTLAARFCDRLVLLHEGQCVTVGKPQDVLTPDNLKTVFDVDAELYRDPHGQWALSVKVPEQQL